MIVLKETTLPHLFHGDGVRLDVPCPGIMQVVWTSESGVSAACSKCGEGFKMHFTIRSGEPGEQDKIPGADFDYSQVPKKIKRRSK